MQRDAIKIKEEIISILQRNGPSLPAQIAKKIEQSILFTSAFLSELFSEKRLKMSYMKIGSSPLYFLEGQELTLEKFSDSLKGKEKEAFLFLKEKKFLKDSELEPAIRVALREIKDFAIPFKVENGIFWRFFNTPENEFTAQKGQKEIKTKTEVEIEKAEKEKTEEMLEEQVAQQTINKKEEPEIKPKIKIKKTRLKKETKKDESFFNKVKENLTLKNIEILDILDFSKNEIILKVKKEHEEKIVFAFNKKKISEQDFIKAAKKASESSLSYEIIFSGKLPKKLEDFIKAVKGLSSVEILENS